MRHSSASQCFLKWQCENSTLPFHHSCKGNLLQYLSKCLLAVNALPVYFGCYDHCKISFCIGQVCRGYNDITSCRKPAKSADFLGIAVRNTAHQRLQVYKRSSLWFPTAVRYLENMETYWTTLAIQAVLTEGDFHTAFPWSCRNWEGKAGIGMEGGEVPATSSIQPILPASMQLHCLPFTSWEFFTEGSIHGWWL